MPSRTSVARTRLTRTPIARNSIKWSGQGINYSASSTAVVNAELPTVRSLFPRIRPQFPLYTADSTLQRYICTSAKALGFYVVWGITTPTPCNATQWTAFKAAVVTMAATAQSMRIDEFSIGNECELHADGTTLLATTVRSELRTLVASVKAVFFGVVSYQADQSQTANWASEGIGSLDRIGFNVYSSFTSKLADMATIGFAKAYISEFSMANGYIDANGSEDGFSHTVMNIVAQLRAAGVLSAYYYTYKGDTPDKFELLSSNTSQYRGLIYPLAGARQ